MSLISSPTPALVHPNLKLLSHSSCTTLHSCDRRFELYKLMPPTPKYFGEDNNQDFGSIVGIGVQELFRSRSLDKAYMAMFTAWKGIIDGEEGEKNKKTFWHCLFSIDKFIDFIDVEFRNCELAYFDGKPAVELGFIIDIGNGWSYRGFLDALLIDQAKNCLVPYEGKTTGLTVINEAMYKNSGQALGYSLVTDAICYRLGIPSASSFEIKYAIYQSRSYAWTCYSFLKNHSHRAVWLKNILKDVRQIEENVSDDFFPMHGESCFEYGRPCKYFELCETSNKYIIGDYDKIELKVDDESKYQFRFTIDEIIESQLAKLEGAGV